MLRRTLAVLACSLVLVSCAPKLAEDSMSDETPGASDSSPSDLPDEPQCPGGLGDIVSCECATVRECVLRGSGTIGCFLTCELPAPCPAVTCDYDGSTGGPGCEADLDVAALECVFEALASGEPFRWKMEVKDSYPFVSERFSTDLFRLGASAYLRVSSWSYHNDVEDSGSSQVTAGVEFSDTRWMECREATSAYARFDCLRQLADTADPCADPTKLVCPK